MGATSRCTGFGGAEEHKGEFANTVAQSTDKIANADRPELFGDGSQTRDFTHVDDVVRACELAAEHELQGIYNVGTEERYSFNEMVDMINAELGTDVDPKYIENPLAVYVHADSRRPQVRKRSMSIRNIGSSW